jgi:hypothetical protein
MTDEYVIPDSVKRRAAAPASDEYVIPESVSRRAAEFAPKPEAPKEPGMVDRAVSAVKRGLSSIDWTPEAGTTDTPRDGAVRRGSLRGVTPYAGGDAKQGPAGAGRGTVNPPMVGEGRRADESVIDMAGRPPQGEVPEVERDYAADSVAPREQERRARDLKYLQGTGVASETPPEVAAGMRMERALRGTNVGPVVQGVASGMAELGKTIPGAVSLGADALGADSVSEFARGASRVGSNFQQAAMPQAEGFDRNVANIFSSVTASLPFMATGGAGAGFRGAGTLMFGQTAMADYGERRAAGVDPLPAAVTASVTGAAEVLGERFGFGEQTKAVKGLMTQLLRQGAGPDDLAINAVKLLVKEVPGEQLTTAAQFLNEKYNIGGRTPEATLADYFKQVQDTLITTIGQSGIVGGAPVAIDAARGAVGAADRGIARSAGELPSAAAQQQAQAEVDLQAYQQANPPAGQESKVPTVSPYEAARAKGFHVDPPLTTDAPMAQRSKTAAVFENLASLHGIPAAAVARAKQVADTLPLGDVGGFYIRFVSSLQKRGLAPADIDPDVLSTVAAGPIEPPPEVKPGKAEAVDVPADTGAIDAAELLGTPSEPQIDPQVIPETIPAIEPAQSEAPATPIQATDPAGIVGEPINDEWRAFTPESGTKGLPRADMPQIKAEHRGPLVNFLNARGIAHESEVEIPSNQLKPTQAEFSPARIKAAQEFKGGDRSILVSADGHVVDGHHQWMAKLDKGEPVKAIVLNAPLDELLPIVREFPSAQQDAGASTPDTPPPSAEGTSTALSTATGEKAELGRLETTSQETPNGNAVSSGAVASDSGTQESGDAGASMEGAGRVPAESAAVPERPGAGVRQAAPVRGAAAGTDAPVGRVLARAGRTPNAAEPIELRQNKDGTLTPWMGGHEMLDFDSGQPITLAGDVSDMDAKKAIRAAGAVTSKVNFFAPDGTDAAPEAPTQLKAHKNADGSVLVKGDPAAIAVALPDFKGIKGTRGVTFGRTIADKVTAALDAKQAERKAAAKTAAKATAGLARKEAAPEKGTADKKMPAGGAKLSVVSDDVFYSELSEQIDKSQMKQGGATAWQQYLDALAKRGSIKADEVEWTGLREWLAIQPGKVSKDQISEFLLANGVQVTETVLGDLGVSQREQATRDLSAGRIGLDEHDRLIAESAGDPKYSRYTLPGGTNYREVLLMLPGKEDRTRLPNGFVIKPSAVRKFEVYHSEHEERGRYSHGETKAEAIQNFWKTHPPKSDYNSGHWDGRPNVIAHIRLNDSTDAEGKRVLFVEEVQSDWGQQGKKKGFRDDAKATDLRAKADALRSKMDVTTEEGRAAFAERARLLNEANELESDMAVPKAPFVGKTDAWVALALKRVIKMAVDEGYDRVAFVNGEQSAERYDLSKQISKIRYDDASSGGIGDADLSAPEERGILYAYNMQGNLVIDKSVSADELEDHIGKEAARKLLEQKPARTRSSGGTGVRRRELSGLDLKVGGEGMKAFYDQIVPKVAKEVFRKLGGGDLGITTITTNTDGWHITPPSQTASGRWMVKSSDYNSEGLQFDTEAEAKAALAERRDTRKQTSFDITPAMRMKAAGGVPLFSYTDALTDLPESDTLASRRSAKYEEASSSQQEKATSLARGISARPDFVLRAVEPPASRSDLGAARALARGVFGHQVIFTRQPVFRLFNGATYDSTAGDVVFIDVDSPRPALAVLGHELLHRMRATRPDLYDRLGGRLRSVIRNDREYAQLLDGKRKNLGLEPLSADSATEELIADIVGDEFVQRSFWKAMAKGQPKGFRDVLDYVLDFLDKLLARIKRARPFGTDLFVSDIQAARAAIVDAMRDFSAGEVGPLADAPAALKLSEAVVGQTDTPAFKKWFGDSKVVDAGGKPLVVYHGTAASFGTFDANAPRSIQADAAAQGFYFTRHPEDASGYATGRKGRDGANVLPVYLSLQNPYIWPTNDFAPAVISAARRAELEAQGYDGILYRDGEEVVAFQPEQIKSAIGNNGNFAPTNPDIRMSAAEPGWSMPEGSRFDNFVYKFQDKNIDLKRAVAAIKQEQSELADKWDAYLQEELFHGRAAKRTQDFVSNELSPLLADMKARSLSTAEVDEFLHARHAEEANALIAQRNRDANDGQLDLDGKAKGAPLQDGGSGMTNAEAKAYFDKLDPAQRKRLEAVAARVDAIIAKTRQTYVDYGLESKTMVDGWAKLFKHYVPLMREDKDGGMGIGQGFSIKGKESKHRTGSTAKVVDILANIALQREKAIVRGEKNRVAVALAGLVKTNPNPDFWSFDTIPTERVMNEKTALVETREVPNFRNRPNVLVAKILGSDGQVHERLVSFNEKNERAVRMVEAMKNLDAAQLEGVLAISAKITRYFSAINTQYNPVFGFVNLVRDVQGSAINLNSTDLKDRKAAVLKNIGPALRAIYRTERGKDAKNQEMTDLWQELQLEGGMTGFRDLFRTSEDRAKAIEKELDPHGWMDNTLGKVFTAGGALKVPVAVAQDKAGWLFEWLSDYNQAMEGATRLAAYKVGLEHGLSKQRAASLAKNLTVNFNRKGQAGSQAGALYAFFNAAMQGNARMGQVLFDMKDGQLNTLKLGKAGKKIVAGGIALGAIQALVLAAAGFDDDEPPEFVRERSLILPIGGKKYLTLPMPLGWHVLPNIGRITTDFALGGFKGPAKHVVKLAGIFAEAFNPIGNAGFSLQTITPTPVDPLAALAENRDWTGKPIARTSFDKTKPGFQQAKDTASSPAKWVAEGINWMSGGTEYVAGSMSPTPDQIDYLWGQATGGVGREIGKLEQTAKAGITGESLPPHKIPLVGRFYGDAEGQSSQGTRFYANVQRLNEHEAQLKGLAKDGRNAEFKVYEKEHPEAKLIGMGNQADRIVQALRTQKRELLKREAPRAHVKKVEDQISSTMKQLNDAVKARSEKAKEPA